MDRAMRIATGALAAIGLVGLLTACGGTPLKHSWGRAVKGNAAAMTANPDAGRTVDGPIEGMDPLTAELVVETYEKNQKKDAGEPRKLFLISQ